MRRCVDVKRAILFRVYKSQFHSRIEVHLLVFVKGEMPTAVGGSNNQCALACSVIRAVCAYSNIWNSIAG